MQSRKLFLLALMWAASSMFHSCFASEPASDAPQATDEDLVSRIYRLTGRENPYKNGKPVFQILNLGLKRGKLRFNGWKSPPSYWHEDYDVEAGPDGDVRLALVKKEIEIIRRFYSEDFLWVSSLSGETVKLSARPKDNASLEVFLLKENFPG